MDIKQLMLQAIQRRDVKVPQHFRPEPERAPIPQDKQAGNGCTADWWRGSKFHTVRRSGLPTGQASLYKLPPVAPKRRRAAELSDLRSEVRCAGITRTGTQCTRNRFREDSNFCKQHSGLK